MFVEHHGGPRHGHYRGGVRVYQPRHQQNNYYSNDGNHPSRQFWCETCDRDFRNQSLLEDHIKQHERCNIDGCKFVAHPKVITKHIQMQHSTGLYKKISNLNNPEDIAKWREERRRKYPTKQNIEKKDALRAEKIERGEKMGLRNNKKFNDSQRGNKRKNSFGSNPRNKFQKRNSNIAKATLSINVPNFDSDDKLKLKPFAGIQNLDMNSCSEDDEPQEEDTYCIDDDIDNVNEVVSTNEENTKNDISLCSALSNLVNDYGSSDEEAHTSITIPKINLSSRQNGNIPNMTTSIDAHNEIQGCKVSKSDDDSGPEEVKTVVSKQEDVTGLDNTKSSIENIKKNKKPLKRVTAVKKYKPPSTLLRKLLGKEIEHERNVILQCIRHIVKNNYFDKLLPY